MTATEGPSGAPRPGGSPTRSWSSRLGGGGSRLSTSWRSCVRPTRARSPGELGALLRREGLYSSHLTTWRKQREEGSIKALVGRGGVSPVIRVTLRSRRCSGVRERAEAELAKARKVIEVQGNVSALLGELLEPRGATEPGSTER